VPKRPARLRDWVFGSTGKRLLLAALLAEPERRWSKQALADAAGVHRKGGVDGHVLALRQLGLLKRRRGGSWAFVVDHELVDPLARLLEAIDRLPDRRLNRS
jgi:hypothetical protein